MCGDTAITCRGLWELGEFAQVAQTGDGMTFSNVASHGNGMGVVWLIFVLQWPVFMVAAWYLEQVVSAGTGVRRHWLFPFDCCRKGRSGKCDASLLGICQKRHAVAVLGAMLAALHQMHLHVCGAWR